MFWVQELNVRAKGPSWLWSYHSWIYNYLSPLMLWVRIWIRARCTTLCDKVCQRLVTGRWFSPGPPVSSTNKTDCHNITEILLKDVLNTIKQTKIHLCTSLYKTHCVDNDRWFSVLCFFKPIFFSRHFIIKCSIQYVVYVGSNIQQIMMDNSQCYTVTLPDHSAFCEW